LFIQKANKHTLLRALPVFLADAISEKPCDCEGDDGPHGGLDGEKWSDKDASAHGSITAIEIRAGEAIDGIRVT
jgi:hypothetical protein